MTTPILLLGLGIVLIIAEVLFPSFGVLSLLATVSIVGAVALAFRIDASTGITFLIVTGLLVPAALMLGFKLFPKSPIGKHFVASGTTSTGQATTDPRDLALAGAEGVTETVCRPAGIARFDARRVDVVSRGEIIERGTPVRVLEVKGNRVVVAAVSDASAGPV